MTVNEKVRIKNSILVIEAALENMESVKIDLINASRDSMEEKGVKTNQIYASSIEDFQVAIKQQNKLLCLNLDMKYG